MVQRPIWLVEATVYGAEAEPLFAEIRRQGMTVQALTYRGLQKEKTFADGECVLGYGTFPFAREIQLHHRWTPGAWCDSANLGCACYLAYFGRFLLNQHYAILPGVEAIRQRDWLFEVVGKEDEVFVRP